VLFLRPQKKYSHYANTLCTPFLTLHHQKNNRIKMNNLETETSEIIVQEDLQRLGINHTEALAKFARVANGVY
jgi:hypothetical protein